MFVELDQEQLGSACRDWLTVDQTVSIHDDRKGITLACPDAPLVQVGDFNFGKESKYIERKENPVLLAWAMNNYWDTNFWASQPGRIHLRYELSTFDRFDPMEAYRSGIAAANPVAINAAVNCDREEEGQWYRQSSGTIVMQYMKPAENGSGFILMLRNIGNGQSEYVFTGIEHEVSAAFFVNPLEEVLRPAKLIGKDVRILMQPGEIAFVNVIVHID